MKKFLLLLIVLPALFFTGCGDSPPADPDPVVYEWLDTVPGFWNISGLIEQEVIRSSSVVPEPEALPFCYFVWNEDGTTEFWFDADEDGILTPGELEGEGTYSFDGEVLTIDGWDSSFEIGSVSPDAWDMKLELKAGETYNFFREHVAEFNGWIQVFFTRGFPVYMTDDHLIQTEFSFVFDDMNDYDVYEGRYITYPGIDCVDWFEFLWGTVNITIGNSQSSGGMIWVNGTPYRLCPLFMADEIYDVFFSVQPDGVASVTFVSRYDGDQFTKELTIPYYDLGSLEFVRVNDADVYAPGL